jgi:probable addiction module antidote protein
VDANPQSLPIMMFSNPGFDSIARVGVFGRTRPSAEPAAYLETVLEEGDQAAIMLALRQVAQAQGGVAEIARKAKLTREATHKMLSKSGNPELRSLTAVLEATGLRIAVKPIEKQAA